MEENEQAKAQVVQQTTTQPIVNQKNQNSQPVVSPELKAFSDNWKIATQYSKSSLVPDNYKNKPENVIIALGMAQKTGFDVYTIMNNLNIVKGKAGWSGSFCRTLIETTGLYKDLDLIWVGEKGKDSYGCYLQAVRKSDGKIIKGTTVDIAMAKAERWTTNTKWTNMPELMLSYRATAFFARVYCPSALNGVYTTEEIEDVSFVNSNNIMEDIL